MQSVKDLFKRYPKFIIASFVALAVIGAVIIHGLHGTREPLQQTRTQAASSQSITPAATSASTKPSLSAITGFGATLDDWNSYHTPDPNFDTNKVYDAMPGLGVDSSHTDKYYAVVITSGRVTNYEMRLPNGSSLAAAQKEVMQEFPPDASILWQQTKGECSQMEVTSARIGEALGNPSVSGGSQGQAFVEFQTDTPATESQFSYYDPSNVNMATLSQGSYSAAADAPGC